MARHYSTPAASTIACRAGKRAQRHRARSSRCQRASSHKRVRERALRALAHLPLPAVFFEPDEKVESIRFRWKRAVDDAATPTRKFGHRSAPAAHPVTRHVWVFAYSASRRNSGWKIARHVGAVSAHSYQMETHRLRSCDAASGAPRLDLSQRSANLGPIADLMIFRRKPSSARDLACHGTISACPGTGGATHATRHPCNAPPMQRWANARRPCRRSRPASVRASAE